MEAACCPVACQAQQHQYDLVDHQSWQSSFHAVPGNNDCSGADQAAGQVDQLLHHRANTAAFGRMPDRGKLAQQSHLIDCIGQHVLLIVSHGFRMTTHQLVCSMSGKGNCYDNACLTHVPVKKDEFR